MRKLVKYGVELTVNDQGRVVAYRDTAFFGTPCTIENGRLAEYWEHIDVRRLEPVTCES